MKTARDYIEFYEKLGKPIPPKMAKLIEELKELQIRYLEATIREVQENETRG